MMKATHLLLPGLLILLLSTAFFLPSSQALRVDAPALTGAWELVEADGQAFPEVSGQRATLICSDAYWMLTHYNVESKAFAWTTGGTYALKDGRLSVVTEFHSLDTSQVGLAWGAAVEGPDATQVIVSIEMGEQVSRQTYKRLDDAGTALAGNWRFFARKQGDELSPMRTGPRKTVKLLTGTRFQWAAINTETKQFSGTGGGSYTFENGKYTEQIEFFSRDSSRVGASLSFDGRVEGKDWHHSGKSSKGDPMYEIWRRE